MFGVFFLIAAWLLRSGRVTAGAVFAGILCLVEVVAYPSWYKHSALNWTYQTAFALVSLAGLIGAITVLGRPPPPPGRGLTRRVGPASGSGWRCTRGAR